MKRSLRAAPVLLLGVGCVPAYKPPTADQPHAVAKLRRSYDTKAGTHLREVVDIDEHRALADTSGVSLLNGSRIDSILVHPLPSTFKASSSFFHQEQQLVRESYQEPHTEYRSESYDCSTGFGTNKSYRTCTRQVSHTRYETKYRSVWKTVEVSDGSCEASLRVAPQAGRVYLFQYTYHAQAVCSLSCYEQRLEPGGAFQNQPCPEAPPED